jgi:zinc D-Ala-D-Ala carboxypeptidase
VAAVVVGGDGTLVGNSSGILAHLPMKGNAMQLSPHFTLEEMTKSEYAIRHGIPNEATPEIADRLSRLCNLVLERIRMYVANQRPIRINSGYRSPKVNAGIGGAATSQHLKGEAADFEIPGMSNRAVVEAIRKNPNIPFDQLIYEGGEEGWIHISYCNLRERKEVLTAVFVNGRAQYSPFA